MAHPALQMLDSLSEPAPQRPSLLGITLPELETFVVDKGHPKYRATQLFSALYNKRYKTFDEITNLSKKFRAELSEHYDIARPQMDEVQVSDDGTRKYRFLSPDNAVYEAVYIPIVAKGSKTNTLCVSSQTGCAVGCKFCYTASLRRNRNLAASEIVGQVLAVQDDVAQLGESARVTNIVYMGMGEPLLNYEQVVQSIRVLLDPLGADFSKRRVTVSTSGIVPRIDDLGRDVPTQLAISLNATTDEVRNRIMPINKKWPIAELMASLRRYPLTRRQRFTIEYVMLKDVNDSLKDAKRLVQLLEGIPVKLNLLPLNEHDRTEFESPSDETVDAFQQVIMKAGLAVYQRTPRGRDIAAACGQLGETTGR